MPHNFRMGITPEAEVGDEACVLNDTTIEPDNREASEDGYKNFARAMVEQAMTDKDVDWFRSDLAQVCCDVMGLDSAVVWEKLLEKMPDYRRTKLKLNLRRTGVLRQRVA